MVRGVTHKKSRELPNTLVVGAAKAATTWIYACLDEHPEAFVPSVKETDFFSKYYYRGFDWYEKHFEGSGEQKSVVDISPTYMIDPGVPPRIYEWNPQVQLIFSLRNPIERAYSHYCMHLRGGKVGEDLDAELTRNRRYLEEGLYYRHISRYLQYFRRENILILVYDDLKNDPESYLGAVYDFLGIDYTFRPSLLNDPYHVRKVRPRFQTIYNLLVGLSSWIQKTMQFKIVIDFIKVLRRSGWVDLFHRLNQGEKYPVLTETKRKELVAFFQSDVESLSKLLGRDLTHWLQIEDEFPAHKRFE